MVAEMALRLSGRFSVMVATGPELSRISVENINSYLLSVHEGSMSIVCANLIGHFEGLRKPRRLDSGVGPGFAQRRKNVFGSDIADQTVSGKGTAAKTSQRAVKPATSRFIRSENFFLGPLWAAVQVDAQLDSRNVIFYLAIESADKFRCGGADGIGQRNGAHPEVLEPLQSIGHDFRSPGLVIRISKGHRNIDYQPAICGSCLLF